ncbi:LysR family transcriptional regulator [Polaromonas sp. P1-6]|nr:LysR family transcriptional regulator [Polaromonas sp. P1-6]
MDKDLDLLDVKLLRLLDQLYATRSVTRSAEALGQSQPTVSIWLARLRKELGDPLFVRTAEGMLPTPRTDALMGTVREVLDGLQRLAQAGAAFDPSTAQRRFSICMTDASHITLLPRLLAHVRALAPGVALQASRIDANLAQALQAGEADLAVGFLPWLDAGFYQQTLYAQDWICLANAQHPRVIDDQAAHWNLDVYQAEAHIGISSGTGYQLLDNSVASQHITRRIRLELPGFLGLSAILSTSDLIATLPRHIGETLARSTGLSGLRVLPCPFEIPGFTVKQYWHARYHHDAACRWLRGVCAELFMKSASSPENTGQSSYLLDSNLQP